MKKLSSSIIILLVITALLSGCKEKETKVSNDATSTATPMSNTQQEYKNKQFKENSDAASSATAASTAAALIKQPYASYYLAKPVNVSEDNWLAVFAGDKKGTINIKLGQVIYIDNLESTESYIELNGRGNKLSLILNGSHYEYDEATHKIRRKTLNFLTGKKLLGNEVIKDYSEGTQKIVMIVDFDEQGFAKPSILFCSNNDGEDIPHSNYYVLEVKNDN